MKHYTEEKTEAQRNHRISLFHCISFSSFSVTTSPDERSQDSHLEGFPEVKSGLN